MTPREFLDAVVRPNVADFNDHYADLRLAYNAISAVDALAAHIYTWAKETDHPAVTGIAHDSAYRDKLAKRNEDFSLLRDVAKAQKHVQLIRGITQVTRADQLQARVIGYGEGGYGEGRYGGVQQVVISINATDFRFLEKTLDGCLVFLEGEMEAIGA